MDASKWARPIRRAQRQHALQIVVEKDRTQFDMKLFRNDLRSNLQCLVQVHRRIAHTIDALHRHQTML